MGSTANVTLKKRLATVDYDILYPKTTIAQVVGLLVEGRVDPAILPDSVFDSLYFNGASSALTSQSALLNFADYTFENGPVGRSSKGVYYVMSTAGTITTNTTTTAGEFGVYSQNRILEPDGTQDATSFVVQIGDWVVLNSYTGSGTSGDPYLCVWAVINNTYEDATTSAKGIVKLSGATDTSALTDPIKAITETILSGLITTTVGVSNKLMASVHNHDTAYQAKSNDLTAIDALAGTSGFLKKTATDTWALDTNTYLTTQSSDVKTITVSDTDSGHTWTSTGSAAAGSTGDTVTFVDGDGVDIDVSAGTKAVRFSHTDTSSLTGAQGTSGIASITVDGFGHITAVTTATYNNYSLPLAANGTRGGVQIGFTDTELNRAVLLSSEKAYIALPRQIPAVTLNGALNYTPGFYAPTSVGTAGQIMQSAGSGAPTWLTASRTFYNTTANAIEGDIIFEVA